jgi:hypothetical protein
MPKYGNDLAAAFAWFLDQGAWLVRQGAWLVRQGAWLAGDETLEEGFDLRQQTGGLGEDWPDDQGAPEA